MGVGTFLALRSVFWGPVADGTVLMRRRSARHARADRKLKFQRVPNETSFVGKNRNLFSLDLIFWALFFS
jgi:hypothetical protein